MAIDRTFLTVTQLNTLLKAKFETDDDLHNLLVKGEISQWKPYASATYFSIKDDKSVLPCILWADSYLFLPFEPKVGDEVLLTGSLSVYVPRGSYSFLCSKIELYGHGNQLLALEALKKKLLAEGLFDEKRKRPIPSFPKTIGIIVGKDSAAKADLLKNLQRRWPLADLVFFPSLVQGKDAPKDILRAFRLSQSYPLDVLIIARGGGSSEDLSAFNDESVARAVAESKMPTIAAIGHEIDFSIVDFVADKRVSTPTGAAEAATPDQAEIRQQLIDNESRLHAAWQAQLQYLTSQIEGIANRPFFKNPATMYSEEAKEVQDLSKRLHIASSHQSQVRKQSFLNSAGRLKALNPFGVLERGYSITETSEGEILKKVSDAKPGDEIKTTLKDGIIHSKVL